MRPGVRLVSVLLVFTAARAVWADPVVYVDRGGSWRYLRGQAEASSPIDAWREVDFVTTGWSTGTSPIGYGEPEIVTDLAGLAPPMEDNYSSVFARRPFEVSEAAAVVSLEVNIRFDDGAVLWINGFEVLRVNMPGAPGTAVAHDGFASSNHEATEYENYPLPDPQGYLVDGTNVLAVQFFNNQISSSDAFLDLDLVDPFGPDVAAPQVVGLVPAAGATVRSLTQVEVTFDEDVTGVTASDLRINGVAATGLGGSGAGPYVFSFPQPAIGSVTVSWSPSQGISDLADPPNAFAGGGDWAYELDPDAPAGDLVISEVLSSNRSGLTDEDGDREDWFEVCNRGGGPVDLGGWSASDDEGDPGKWVFPSVLLAAGDCLVVFCSGKDRRPTSGNNIHTNFRLNGEGEFVGIFTAESPRQPVSVYSPSLPPQRPDISYGLDGTGQPSYLDPPTPGQPNGASVTFAGVVADPRFRPRRGFYDEPVDVDIFTPTPDAEIYYTLDWSEPTPGNGTLYDGTFTVNGTSARGVVNVRAAAYRSGWLPSRVVTHTFIFPQFVLDQPDRPAGFPTSWGSAPAVDYGMDPQVVDNPTYRDQVLEGLQQIPSVSIVMRVNDMFGSSGIYSNPQSEGVAWERACSAEFIYPDGREGTQIDCGIRIQGGASRTPSKSPKHALRLLFKGDYGPTKLRFPLFPDSRVDEFDTISLRANYNNSWIHWDSGQRSRGTMVRDQWVRDTQLAMGQLSSHGLFMHVYINGLYWGMFNVVERPSAPFAAAHLGGEKEEYDALNSASAVDGNTSAWSTLLSIAGTNLASFAQYQAIQNYLDVPGLVDYMMVNFFGSNADWPSHNWYAVRKREAGAHYKFISWDAERIFESVNSNRTGVNTGNSPGIIYDELRDSPEFRLLFGDHVHRHFFNGGALTPAAVEQRWLARSNAIDKAVVCESARWGDYRRDVHSSSNGPYEFYTKNDFWLPEQSRLRTSYFPQRSNVVLNQFRSANLYPDVGAPILNQHGGEISPGFQLTLSRPGGTSGTIYYTLDGLDPRVQGSGAIGPSARTYSGAITLSDHTLAKARIRTSGGEWSALAEAVFSFTNPAAGLRISEIMYHPSGGSTFEFVELENAGEFTIGLTGLYFSNGIGYNFLPDATLAPGEHFVLVSDAAAFASRYPGVDVDGTFTGNLSNSGEKLTIRDLSDNTVTSVDYDDEGFWPISPDGFGYSLVSSNLTGEPDDPANWRASATVFGSPGEADAEPVHGGAAIAEILTRGGGIDDAVEIFNGSDRTIDVGGWYLSDDRSGVSSLKKFRIPGGTVLNPGDRVVFDEGDFDPNPGTFPSFSLGDEGGAIYLSSALANGDLSGAIVGHEFEGSETNISLGVWETSTGRDFTALSSRTLGTANTEPAVGPLVINEIHYHPALHDDEFVEIYNLTGAPVPLYDDTLGRGWRLVGARNAEDTAAYEFPAGTVVPAGGYLVLASADPASFRFRYAVPAGVPVIGPYGGGLQNSGEFIKIKKPLGTGGAFIVVDQVRYNDRAPWAEEADGDGPSLERVRPADYGNDVVNWEASLGIAGTPGALNSVSDPSFNQRPLASFTFAPQGDTLFVDFDASASQDPDGSITSYEWDFGDGTSGDGQLVSHAFPAAGTYTVRLTVRDDEDEPGTASRAVSLAGPDPGGTQVPGDSNQDGFFDIADAVSLVVRLFPPGAPPTLPCEGDLETGGNLLLLDANGDASVNVTDAVQILNNLFLNGPAHVLGNRCIPIPECPSACVP